MQFILTDIPTFILAPSAIPRFMRAVLTRLIWVLIATMLAAAAPLSAQQAPDAFRWIDFHSDKDQDVMVWVTRTLAADKWTSIREIGVQYDAALVVTTERGNPQAPVNMDTFTVWSVSLSSHLRIVLLKGVNLRLLDWMLLAGNRPRELGALYDDCRECAATTYFTAFYYDDTQHAWAARWMRGSQAIPLVSTSPPDVTLTQVYAALAEPDGRVMLATWSHFDYGKLKPAEDFIYQYDLDPWSGLERTQLLSAAQADAMKLRLCRAQGSVAGLARGQDSFLCQQPAAQPKYERKPVTTPANNHGQSDPPGVRHPIAPSGQGPAASNNRVTSTPR